MKIKAAFLILILFLAQVHAQTPAPLSVGSIVSISGRITNKDENAGKFSLALNDFYFITPASVLTVNGKRGTLADLTVGMKVSGSAEVAKAAPESGQRQKKIVRMLTATTDSTAATTASMRAQPAVTPGVVVPPSPEELAVLKQNLAGTFWTPMGPGIMNRPGGNIWISLNADGTVDSSESNTVGNWSVIGRSVEVRYWVGENMETTQLSFTADLSRGMVRNPMARPPSIGPGDRTNARPAMAGMIFSWTRVMTITPEMREKASRRTKVTSNAASTPPAPASEDAQQGSSELVKANHNNLVFVTGKGGAGSGFIATMNGGTYLVTNAHVAAGINNADFKTLDGAVVPRGPAEAAVGHDILRIALPKRDKTFEIMDRVDQNVGIGDEIVVLGNAEGSGVINTILGRIVGIGPNLLEIDAQFVPGNSGSPIIHIKTGKVIGVATYVVTRKYDSTTGVNAGQPLVRRFGFRIDSVKTWQPVNWQTFYAQAAAMERVETLTEALDNFFRDLYENKSRVTIARHAHPAIKTRIGQWQQSKSRKLSTADRESADANFISFLKIACQADVAEVQRSFTYDYFQRSIAKEQEIRNEMANAFTKIIQSIRE